MITIQTRNAMAFIVCMNNGEAFTCVYICICNDRMFALFTIVVTNVHGDGIIGGNSRNFE
jgi:hypothetical protein